MSDQPKSPRFRFNLRHVFVAVTGLCIVCAASARIAKHGGSVNAGELKAGAVVLLFGTLSLCVLRWLEGRRTGESAIMLPLVTLLAGPVLSLGYWAIDLFWLSREYFSLYPMDRYDRLLPALELGILIGVVVATAFTTGSLISAGLTKAAAASKGVDRRLIVLLAFFWVMVLVPLLFVLVVVFLIDPISVR